MLREQTASGAGIRREAMDETGFERGCHRQPPHHDRVEDPSRPQSSCSAACHSPARPHRPAGVRNAIELLILERRADKRQPATIRCDRQQLGLFFTSVTQQGVGDSPEDITKALILA